MIATRKPGNDIQGDGVVSIVAGLLAAARMLELDEAVTICAGRHMQAMLGALSAELNISRDAVIAKAEEFLARLRDEAGRQGG